MHIANRDTRASRIELIKMLDQSLAEPSTVLLQSVLCKRSKIDGSPFSL